VDSGDSSTLHLEIAHSPQLGKKNQTWHFIKKNSRNGMGLIKNNMEGRIFWKDLEQNLRDKVRKHM
jgi:hypothetical protein